MFIPALNKYFVHSLSSQAPQDRGRGELGRTVPVVRKLTLQCLVLHQCGICVFLWKMSIDTCLPEHGGVT